MRVWPWSRRDTTPLPSVHDDDGRDAAWQALTEVQQRLKEARDLTDRIHRVRRALLHEGTRNHFAEAIEHAMRERRA